MPKERYTMIQHNIRKHFRLTTEEYEVLDAIYCLSRNQACDAKAKYFVELFDVSERSYYNIIKILKDKQLIEKQGHGYRSAKVWDEAMEDRIAPWTDPSEKPAEPAPEPPASDTPEGDKPDEKPVIAEFAVCPECAKSLQNLQLINFDTAKIAVNHCKKCSKALQKLQSTTAKNAVLNIVINNVIDNDNNNTALADKVADQFSGQVVPQPAKTAPAKAGTPFNAIDQIFISGSIAHTGTSYYKDAKESKQIKLLESRFVKDPEKFVNDTRKFYWLITKSGDQFWMSQPFTPSAFNSLYNRVLGYKPSADVIKREERKDMTDEDIIIERYGSCSKSDLDYLVRAEMICREDYEMLLKRLPLEAVS